MGNTITMEKTLEELEAESTNSRRTQLFRLPLDEENDLDESFDDSETSVEICISDLEETEPLELSVLPADLLNRVVKKLDFADYVQLEGCSRFTENLLNNRKYSLPHFVPVIYVNKKSVKISNEWDYYDTDIPRIPWHVAIGSAARIKADVVNVTHRVTSNRLNAVSALFAENGTVCEVLNFYEHIKFEPEALQRLIRTLKVNHLECRQFLPKEFFSHPCLRELHSMTLSTSGCTDKELPNLKQTALYMTNDFITAKGLNNFLKQWTRGEREISVIDIDFDTSFNTRDFDMILDGLDANPVWTPELHKDSIVGAIPLEEYYPMTTSDPEHVYSIFQKGNYSKFRIVRLSMGRFEVFSADNESEFLISYLDMDQFYTVMGYCVLCERDYCIHRKYISVQRFKRLFPRANNTIVRGFQLAGQIAAVARYSQLLLGAPLPPIPLTKYEFRKKFYEEDADQSIFQNLLFTLRVHLFHY